MSDDEKNAPEKSRKNGQGPAFLPPLEFSSIVLLMYFPALIQLGLVEDPAGGGGFTENPELAKRNIDLLDLLRDKTKGNLDESEVKFLDGALGQLKLAYLKKAEKLKM